MTCRRSPRLAALAAGGDLTARELEAWRRHSSSCEACRQTERSLREGLEVLRSVRLYEFGEEERGAMRRAVWRAIEEERGRGQARFLRLAWRPLAAAAALALAALGPWLVLRSRGTAPAGVETRAASPATPAIAAAPIPIPAGPVPVAGLAPAHRLPRRRRAPVPSVPRAPSRLEIATPDPDVRIIWLYDSGDAADDATAVAPSPEEVS